MIALFIGLLACGNDAPPTDVSPTQTDVLIISVDTLRADRLGFMDYSKANTPNIDALAKTGRIYTQATTPVPRTTPALGSLQTGLAPDRHGAREVGELITAETTLAKTLTTNGYTAVGISAMSVASPDQNMDRGFTHFEVHHDSPADELSAIALARAKEANGKPLYLWIHYADPHFPYLPNTRWAEQPEAPNCRKLGETAAKGKLARYRLYSNRSGQAKTVLDECSDLYDAEIAFVDHAVGQLLAGWKALGREAPYIVFTADHGENLGEWGLFYEHGPNAHDASLRIPLVIQGPNVPTGKDSSPTTLEDVTPTLLSLLKLPQLPTDGRQLNRDWSAPAPYIRAESGSVLHARMGDYLVAGRKSRLHCIHGPQYSLCDHPRKGRSLFDRSTDPDLRRNVIADNPEQELALSDAWKPWPVERTRQRLIRTDRFSLIDTPQISGTYSRALYDHVADPNMSTDVLANHPDIAAQLGPVLDEWHNRLDGDQRTITDKTEAEEEALRSLGYIE
jgi:arylsulfatase A-like enzyme